MAVQTTYRRESDYPRSQASKEILEQLGFHCDTCGGSDYDMKHPKEWNISPYLLKVTCKSCGRVHFFSVQDDAFPD